MSRRKTQIVVRCLFRKDDLVLLQRRTKLKGNNFGLVGGHVDPNERPLDAVIREVREEIGVRIKAKHLTLCKVVYRGKGDLQKIHLIFEAKKWKGDAQNLEPRYCKFLKWYPKDDLPEKLSPTVKAALSEETAFYVEEVNEIKTLS